MPPNPITAPQQTPRTPSHPRGTRGAPYPSLLDGFAQQGHHVLAFHAAALEPLCPGDEDALRRDGENQSSAGPMHFRVPKSPNPHTDGQTDSTAGGIPSLLSPVSHCISNGFRIPVYGHGPVSHSLPPAGNVTSVAGFMEPWSRTSSSACSGSRDLPAVGCIWPPHQHRHRDCPHLGPAELSLLPKKRVGASTESAISDSRFFNPVAGDALARGRQTAARLTDGETEARSARTWV